MYCVFGVYPFGSDKASLASVHGRVIVADTQEQARSYAPLFGGDRLTVWDEAEETCWFTPLDPNGLSRVCILTGYDPHHTPPNAPVLSETVGKEWRRHVHATYVFDDCGQMYRRSDGSIANLALGE